MSTPAWQKALRDAAPTDPGAAIDFLNDVRRWLHEEVSPHDTMPVDLVQWVPIDKVHANDYNPNRVAKNEMRLLYTSIAHDGYTQPVVTVYDPDSDRYVIVDGFHRFSTLRENADLQERTGGRVPVVVIQSGVNDRMASTVRHNRARGKHSVAGMGQMVFQMLDNGWTDAEVCRELGLEVEEIVRLKHVTGFSKLFDDVDYRKSWKTKRQIRLAKEYREAQEHDDTDDA